MRLSASSRLGSDSLYPTSGGLSGAYRWASGTSAKCERGWQRLRLNERSTKFGPSPVIQLEKIHGLAGASDIAYAVSESLPIIEIVSPGLEEIDAKLWRYYAVQLSFRGRQRSERIRNTFRVGVLMPEAL